MGHPHHADAGNNEFFKRQLKPPEVLMGAPGVSHSSQLPTQDANHSTQKDRRTGGMLRAGGRSL